MTIKTNLLPKNLPRSIPEFLLKLYGGAFMLASVVTVVMGIGWWFSLPVWQKIEAGLAIVIIAGVPAYAAYRIGQGLYRLEKTAVVGFVALFLLFLQITEVLQNKFVPGSLKVGLVFLLLAPVYSMFRLWNDLK